ncbi:hypothetical protein KRR40_44070 [Niabella defluvii]|nr:hypothetical protein KRR40_44070 [Niabella sp. I65]
MPLDEDARKLEAWLNKGMHGQMKYMENHFELRVDPTRLVPGHVLLSLFYSTIFQPSNKTATLLKLPNMLMVMITTR